MAHTLPDLPYSAGALEPVIDERTMQIHHGKHHQAYIDKLNDAIKGNSELEQKSIEDLLRGISSVPENIRTTVRNNGGGHANHSLFWPLMSGEGGGNPSGELADAIDRAFGSFDRFKEEFSNAGATQFGSGWAWLVVDSTGNLKVYSTPNQDSPYMQDDTPVLGLDVWEHAYYLKYQNARAEYIKQWWGVVNWDQVARNLAAARG
jgi:superoxide dismutase, Fe-Mn family